MPPKSKAVHTIPAPSSATDQDGLTVAQALSALLRQAGAYTAGDQVSPCAILWTDPERLWVDVVEGLKPQLPELCVYGAYAPELRTGPAVYLRCIEARALEPVLPEGQLPIFYLPGVGKQQLRAVEECPPELQPLVELQFRGATWHHPNGKDWTPLAFLSSEHGGLGLEVAKDAVTAEALLRALPHLMKEQISELREQRLDADFFNRLLAPDLPSLLLRWMNDPKGISAGKSAEEWAAFCHQCTEDYEFHPQKDGELRATQLLGNRANQWAAVWKRFAEAPQRYPGVVTLLEQAKPAALVFDPEPWPRRNDAAEQELAAALKGLTQALPDAARARILELEKAHGPRRNGSGPRSGAPNLPWSWGISTASRN